MARKTHLFQQTRSPLIEGYSRSSRPLWHAYGPAILLTAIWLLGHAWLADTLWPLPVWVYGALAGGTVGALAGALVSAAWGSRRRFLASLLSGIVVAELVGAIVRSVVGG